MHYYIESISSPWYQIILSQTATLQMGRTVLHYAAGLPDAGYIYSMLTNAGAKEDTVDLVRKKTFVCKRVSSDEVMLSLKVTVTFLNFQFSTYYDIILQ